MLRIKNVRLLVCILLISTITTVLFSGCSGKKIDPEKAKQCCSIADQSVKTGEYDNAIENYNIALENLNPKDTTNRFIIYSNLGSIYFSNNKDEKALEMFNKALEYAEEKTLGYYTINARIGLINKDIESSISNLKKALEIDSEDFDSNNILGLIYLGEYDKHYTHYNEALKHNKKAYEMLQDFKTKQNLALNYYMLEQYDKAEPLFLSIEQSNPEDAVSLYCLSIINFIRDDYESAKNYYEKALEYDKQYKDEQYEAKLKEFVKEDQ